MLVVSAARYSNGRKLSHVRRGITTSYPHSLDYPQHIQETRRSEQSNSVGKSIVFIKAADVVEVLCFVASSAVDSNAAHSHIFQTTRMARFATVMIDVKDSLHSSRVMRTSFTTLERRADKKSRCFSIGQTSAWTTPYFCVWHHRWSFNSCEARAC